MKNKIIASGVILTILGMQTLPVLGYTKDETVYTKMRSNGESYQTIVNSHLKNTDNSDEIIDSSILTDIENVNDDKTFSKDGNKMVWKANKDDVYYKGNTNKELPVDCKITYKLDGNEISADDVAGKSGKVEIVIKYTNKDEHQVNINGKTEKMYTPFVVMLGTIIDNTKASNITISSGKVVDNGKNTMVVGMALPGMKQNLGLNDSDTDIDIPESVTITLETTDFEMGNIYIPKALPVTDLPDERMQFTLGFYGDGDFFTMKGVVEEFLGQVGIDKDISYDAKAGKTFLHPGRQANVVYNGTVIGYLGEVHPTVCENYNMKTRAYVAVIDMPYIYEMANFDKKYEGIAKFPAVSRDISMVVPKEILVGDIEAVIKQRGGKILESYSLFDIYEGDQIKKGFKSVAYNIVFRAKDRTLEENDIAGAMKKILNGLERLGIQLRG